MEKEKTAGYCSKKKRNGNPDWNEKLPKLDIMASNFHPKMNSKIGKESCQMSCAEYYATVSIGKRILCAANCSGNHDR